MTKKQPRPVDIIYDMPADEIRKKIDKEIPIDLSKMEELIDRVYVRHQNIDKHTIAVVLKKTFEILRFHLLRGKSIKIKSFVRFMLMTFSPISKRNDRFLTVHSKMCKQQIKKSEKRVSSIYED